MITTKPLMPYYFMGGLIAALVIITAGAGVLTRGEIYAPFLSETIVAFQYFQDLLSLALAPCLVAALYLTARGSLRAFVIWSGILVYVLYYYSFYAFDPTYTVYYPLYLALLGLSAYSLAGILTAVDVPAFAAHADNRMPVRFIGMVLGMTLLFVPIWLMLLVQGVAAQQPPETFLVFVFDLAFLIPACGYVAVQVWRRRPVGLLLAGMLLVKAALSGILLFGGELLRMQRGGAPAPEQMVMYLFLAVAGAGGLVLYLRNLIAAAPARSLRTFSS